MNKLAICCSDKNEANQVKSYLIALGFPEDKIIQSIDILITLQVEGDEADFSLVDVHETQGTYHTDGQPYTYKTLLYKSDVIAVCNPYVTTEWKLDVLESHVNNLSSLSPGMR